MKTYNIIVPILELRFYNHVAKNKKEMKKIAIHKTLLFMKDLAEEMIKKSKISIQEVK